MKITISCSPAPRSHFLELRSSQLVGVNKEQTFIYSVFLWQTPAFWSQAALWRIWTFQTMVVQPQPSVRLILLIIHRRKSANERSCTSSNSSSINTTVTSQLCKRERVKTELKQLYWHVTCTNSFYLLGQLLCWHKHDIIYSMCHTVGWGRPTCNCVSLRITPEKENLY